MLSSFAGLSGIVKDCMREINAEVHVHVIQRKVHLLQPGGTVSGCAVKLSSVFCAVCINFSALASPCVPPSQEDGRIRLQNSETNP